jgi:hypothetical protein
MSQTLCRVKGSPAFRIDLTDRETVSAYDELPLWSAMFGLLLLKHLPLRPHATVLDVGCGAGFPLLEHYFIRLGFLDGWKEVLRPEEQEIAFSHLEANLNALSESRGEVALTIPMAYVEAVRAP